MKILVTGADGFIGRRLCDALLQRGYAVTGIIQKEMCKQNLSSSVLEKCQFHIVPDISSYTKWDSILKNIDAIIHLAARAHILKETEVNPLEKFREVNFWGTKHLVDAALRVSVKRFIFLSSIGVNGTETLEHPFSEEDKINPVLDYAKSKWEAEQYLNSISDKGLDVVIIRPPLVYGSHVKGNFLRLLKLADTGIPLPLGAVKNKRSMISLENLVNFLLLCLEHKDAANQTFVIADGEDIFLSDLIRQLRKSLDRPTRLISVPQKWLYIFAKMVGKLDTIKKICDPLQVDITKAKQQLGWQPVQSVEDGLKEVVEWYKSERVS